MEPSTTPSANRFRFRAFDGYQMCYDVTGFEHGESNEMAGVFLDGDFYRMVDKIPENQNEPTAIVMQSTGLVDKNGVKIYEGDICRGRTGILFCIKSIEDLYCAEKHPIQGENEVIGNIYEHSHLLNPTHD